MVVREGAELCQWPFGCSELAIASAIWPPALRGGRYCDRHSQQEWVAAIPELGWGLLFVLTGPVAGAYRPEGEFTGPNFWHRGF